MNAKHLVLLLFFLAPLPLLLAPKPQVQNTGSSLQSAEPLVFRAISNISHTLVADIFWLASGSGEMNGEQEDAASVYEAGERIVVADPYFFPAVNYFATYLGSIHGEAEKGAKLYEKAREWDRENVLLYFYEIVLRLTYEKPVDDEVIAALSKQAYLISEVNGYMRRAEVEEMLRGFILYARDKRRQTKKIRDDLLWLQAKSQSEERKARIQQLLDTIDLPR